ncbi:Crp/Fnr family transcriptional regulator [Aquimarina gracilis]|uniref:Crp/Fnr family transcriptional regulator n=1 Tax=Aquimarina gracilis TaxID=874422 RepID=A0ABU5ZU95_9FLAO|nr:Crp/Fnr family transcriptional regulator [Aquimarina gracilis]MEB3345559.1 Crp/Fnr family transcriptional regulator [Aquimarina gracilis]
MDDNLLQYIRRYIDISDSEFLVFSSYLSTLNLKKREQLLRSGDICRARYFITSGCLRLYYIDQKGHEQIMHFGIENWWLTNYDSLLNKIPSHLIIEAVEKTQVLELKEVSLQELYRKIPKMERFFRIIMERTYIATQRRIEFMYSMSGEEIFKGFIDANPEFVQRIPQYMLASYLGITPEYLSFLRKTP